MFVAAIGASIFYLASLFSFHPLDPSPYAASFPPQQISNLTGKLGSLVSGFTFYHFGLVAYLLPLPALFMATLAFLNHPLAFAKSRIFGWIFFLSGIMCFLASYIPKIDVEGFPLSSGGNLGSALSETVGVYVGPFGMFILIVTALLTSAVLITHGSVFRIMRLLKDYFIVKLGLPLLERISDWRPFTKKVEAIEAPAIAAIELPTRLPKPMPEETRLEAECEEPEMPSFKERLIQLRRKKEKELISRREPEEEEDNASHYAPPPLSIFKTSEAMGPLNDIQIAEFEATAEQLTKAFADFAIKGKVVGIQPGPVVTVFEFEAAAGTKLAKMVALIDDIALALKVDSIFIHPVSGKRAVGIQVPNKRRETVFLGDVIHSELFKDSLSPLTFAMGKSLKGEPVCADLAAMPHLLMAGQTGAGKSVAINSLLCSIIMKASPEEVRMILVDPKILELKVYEGIPHLLMPVITEPARASQSLKWATAEMDRRYKLMELARVRHISGFNAFWEKAGDDERHALEDAMEGQSIGKLPFILIVIDELADLMLTAPKEVEGYIQRLAQKARACGIHLVLATQRPSVDVITGVIKANLPCRIAFKVFSRADSRTILDSMGADKLLGKGDMLYLKPGTSKLERIQGAFLDDNEVVNLVEALRKSAKAAYDESAIAWIDQELDRQGGGEKMGDSEDFDQDPRWDEAISIGQRHGIISASFLQRHLKIGYNRAARIVEAMEAQGLVEHASGSKPRKWLGPAMSEY